MGSGIISRPFESLSRVEVRREEEGEKTKGRYEKLMYGGQKKGYGNQKKDNFVVSISKDFGKHWARGMDWGRLSRSREQYTPNKASQKKTILETGPD